MPNDTLHVFRGDGKHVARTRHPDSPTEAEPYVASRDLVRAVNLAIYLKRPLLLEGEAGCGKTRLARAVAYELGLPFYPWYVRSTSEAQEGLYTYDSILRLHDVHTYQFEARRDGDTNGEREDSRSWRDPRDPKAYRRLGALGKAFALQDCPAIVLIDEIDKADIDFPNDLLAVLDDPWAFAIPETGETIKARHKPVVIITSNKEKGNLPAPFLRRCIYYFVEFPGRERLEEIVDAHYAARGVTKPGPDLVEAAVSRFLTTREDDSLYKKPGTSEFLDWMEALRNFTPRPYRSTGLAEGPLPYPELLFKLRPDWQRHRVVK